MLVNVDSDVDEALLILLLHETVCKGINVLFIILLFDGFGFFIILLLLLLLLLVLLGLFRPTATVVVVVVIVVIVPPILLSPLALEDDERLRFIFCWLALRCLAVRLPLFAEPPAPLSVSDLRPAFDFAAGGNCGSGGPNIQSLVKPQAHGVLVGWMTKAEDFLHSSANKSCGSWRMVISVLARMSVKATINKWMVPFSNKCCISAFGRHDLLTNLASLPYVRVSTHISGPLKYVGGLC